VKKQVSFMADTKLIAELGFSAAAKGISLAEEIRGRLTRHKCKLCGHQATGDYCSSCDWMLGRATEEWETAA
jgi:hypothetical protein